jgi:hypothetical protein
MRRYFTALRARLTLTLAGIQEAKAKRQWSGPAEFPAGVQSREGKSRSGCHRSGVSGEGETDGDDRVFTGSGDETKSGARIETFFLWRTVPDTGSHSRTGW